MSDLKKWMNIVNEQLPPTLIDPPEKQESFDKHSTVLISPDLGGGIGRIKDTSNTGTHHVDVKGIEMELPTDKLSLSRADDTDPLMQPSNNIMHINVLKDMNDLLRDRPDPQTGDLVRIDNVYGTAIGPGFGIFMAYSTNGQDAIVSFDDTIITVPVEQISSVVEQEANDKFAQTGNDGAMSPMSLTTNNRVTIGDKQMSHKEEFSKWMDAVEEGLDGEPGPAIEIPLGDLEASNDCECGNWDCPVCFPDNSPVADEEETCPACGHDLHVDSCATDTDDMGLDYDDDSEFNFGDREDMIVLADTYSENDFDGHTPSSSVADPVDAHRGQLDGPGRPAPVAPSIADPSEDVSELIGKIQYMQDMGLSASDKHYDVEQLMNIKNPDVIRRICDKVTGNIHENKESYGDETVKNIFEDESAGSDLEGTLLGLLDKFNAGEIDKDGFKSEIDSALASHSANHQSDDSGFEDDAQGLGLTMGEDDIGFSADSLSGIEQKIAIAKAALERKASGIEEEEPVPDHDHGLRSLGNKIVNAKLKNSGKGASIYAAEDVATPDEEVMEWVKRFADRDQFVSENTRKPMQEAPVAAKVETPAPTPVKEHKDADAETLEWVARFKKLDNR